MTDQQPPQFPHQPDRQQPGFQQQPGFEQQQPGFEQQQPGFEQQQQPGFEQQQQPGFQQQQPGMQQQPPQQEFQQKKGPNPAMLVGAIVLAIALLVGGGYLVVTKVFGGGTEQPPGGTTDTGAGQGELPEQPTVEVPPVVTDVAKSAGLTCHDEATTTFKVKGCYLIESGHLITLRYRIGDDGSITRFIVTVLHNDVSSAERATAVKEMMDPVLAELPISAADREAIDKAIKGDNENVTGDTAWDSEAGGTYNYRFGKDTTTLTVGEKSSDFEPQTPLVEGHQAIFDELTARGWQCEVDGVTIECNGNGGTVVGSTTKAGQPNNETRLTSIMVWFNGSQPTADEPRMIDVYEALAKAGPRGEVLAIGLRMLAEGEKQFFNSDVQFYRGDSYYEVRGVRAV